MTQIPAGWYPDPDTSNPQAPRGQRYWDGQQWTTHVAPPPGAAGPGMPPYAPMPAAAGGPVVATTPDGQVLSGWWRRVGAYLIDWLIIGLVSMLVGWRWMSQIFTAYGDLVREAMRAADKGQPVPSSTSLMSEVLVPILVVSLIAVAVNFVYNVAFLKWKAATPGKLALGLRIRLRERPGPLSWSTVLLRWLGQEWYRVVGLVPMVGGFLGLYMLVDDLWPLWDDKKQALHDKVAKTNVVRVR